MNAQEAKIFLSYFAPSFEGEIEITKKVIQNVPDDKKSYRPDAKSMSAHDLAWHIASTEAWFLDSMLKGRFEMPTEESPAPSTINEILDFYEKTTSSLLPKVKAMSADDLSKVVDFFGMQFPVVACMNLMMHHSIHHRGQLSAYLRPMGAKVPSIYGGSADEPFQMQSASA